MTVCPKSLVIFMMGGYANGLVFLDIQFNRNYMCMKNKKTIYELKLFFPIS